MCLRTVPPTVRRLMMSTLFQAKDPLCPASLEKTSCWVWAEDGSTQSEKVDDVNAKDSLCPASLEKTSPPTRKSAQSLCPTTTANAWRRSPSQFVLLSSRAVLFQSAYEKLSLLIDRENMYQTFELHKHLGKNGVEKLPRYFCVLQLIRVKRPFLYCLLFFILSMRKKTCIQDK